MLFKHKLWSTAQLRDESYVFALFYFDRFNRTILEGALDNFNIQHGSQNQVVTNAIFSHGGLDPLLDHGMVQHRHKVSEMVLTRCKLNLFDRNLQSIISNLS